MADNEVTIVMGAKDAELVRAWQQARKGPQQMAEELKRVKAGAVDAKAGSDKWLSSMKADVAGAVAGVVGLRAAISAVTAEYEQFLTRRREAGNFNVSLGEALGRAQFALSGNELTAQDLERVVRDVSQQTGASQIRVAGGLNAAFSNRGNLSERQAVDTVRATLALFPYASQEEGDELSAASMAVRKKYGGSAEEASGFLGTAMQQAPGRELALFSRNFAPALSFSNYGATLQETGALYSTFGQQGGDYRGAEAGTAMLQLGKQLEAIPQLRGKSFADKLSYLWSDKGASIRNRLTGGKTGAPTLTGEASMLIPMVDLIKGDTETANLYRSNLSEMPTLEQAKARYENLMSMKGNSPALQNVQLQRNLAASSEVLRSDAGLGAEGLTREGVLKVLSDSGQGSIMNWFAGRAFDINTNILGNTPQAAGAYLLRQRAFEVGKSGTTGFIPFTESARASETAAELNRIADLLEGISTKLDDKGVVIESDNREQDKRAQSIYVPTPPNSGVRSMSTAGGMAN